MKEKRTDPKLTEEQRERLDALAKMPDREIDFSDIPRNPSFGRHGFHFRGRHKFIDKNGRRLRRA
jgi:hypothetical protein